MKELVIKRDLLRAVNRSRPNRLFDLQLDDVDFGDPELFLQGKCNSRVRMTAKPESDIATGTCVVHYNRQRISEFLHGIRVPGTGAQYTSSLDVIQKLVDVYGFPLDPNDFVYAAVFGNDPVYIQPLAKCVGFFQNFNISLPFMGEIDELTGSQLITSFKIKVGWFKNPQWWRGYFRDATNGDKGDATPKLLGSASLRDLNVATDNPNFFQIGVTGGEMPVIRAVTINELPTFSYTHQGNGTDNVKRRYFSNGVTNLYDYFGDYIGKEVDIKLWT